MSRKKTVQSQTPETTASVKWYVMFGFNKDDESKTGYLNFQTKDHHQDFYQIVEQEDARRFPDVNVNNIKGFGTPKQWLDYFNSDPELSSWKFHLVPVSK